MSAKTRHEKYHCSNEKQRNSDDTSKQEQAQALKRKSETAATALCTQPKQSRSEVRCRQCHQTFPDRHAHYIHRMKKHFQTGSGTTLQQPPWGNQPSPFEDNQSLREVYEANRPLILANHQEGSVESVYNYATTNDFTVATIMQLANQVYDRQNSAFRFNMEFGLILVNTQTEEYRYFTPYSNESLFERPLYISRRQDLHRLRLRLQRLNITDFILRQRPDTKWKPVLITNFRFIVNSLDYSLGGVHVKGRILYKLLFPVVPVVPRWRPP